MQSHASRHLVSEFLKDLHPDLSAPFPKEVIKDEIAVAYGQRSIPKLIAVLDLPLLPNSERAHCLRVFLGLMSTQEQKLEAIAKGAIAPLTRHTSSDDMEVRTLSCSILCSLACIRQGRRALVDGKSVQALTAALLTTPVAATSALQQISTSLDGAQHLLQSPAAVIAALVALIKNEATPCKACEHAAGALSGMTRNDSGILDALRERVPSCIVGLLKRALAGKLPGADDKAGVDAVLAECSHCLQQLAHHEHGKTQVREAGGIMVLAKLLENRALGTMEQASAALASIAQEKEAKTDVMGEAGQTLVMMLRKPLSEALAANARGALLSSCEHLQARRMLETALEGPELQKLLGTLKETPPDYRYMVNLPTATSY